jgi:hypothetical protein
LQLHCRWHGSAKECVYTFWTGVMTLVRARSKVLVLMRLLALLVLLLPVLVLDLNLDLDLGPGSKGSVVGMAEVLFCGMGATLNGSIGCTDGGDATRAGGACGQRGTNREDAEKAAGCRQLYSPCKESAPDVSHSESS